LSGGKQKHTSNPYGSRQTTSRYARLTGVMGLGVLLLLCRAPSEAQLRKIGEMELRLSGLTATVENAEPVVPKHTSGGIRIVVRAGGVQLSLADLTRFLGPNVGVEGELSGPGFSQPVALPLPADDESLVADPLVLRTPPIPIAGNYRLSSLRVVANGRPVLDVEPSTVPLKVIDQILVTQVSTRALTLDEIRGKGIVLDSDDYLGFEFTMGFKLDSKAVDIKFPVVFDRQGVAVPQPLSPPAAPSREGIQLPTIMPLLLEIESPTGERETVKFTTPSGVVKPITIPAVLVIPGNVGYLKQFFSAQLYVSNGAPVGSGLNIREIKATLKLPPGADLQLGTLDDPLALPELERDGQVITQPLTMDVQGLGADGVAGTDDDEPEMAPAEQGQAEFLIRGEQEGFHQIQFDLSAQLLGLPIGPVTVKGKATGGVLVRNPYFNVTFTVPSVVRTGERFKLRATVTNIGKGIGNDVSMTLDSSRMSGLALEGDASKSIPTLRPGDARVLEFDFVAQRNGKVVATYLKFDTQSGNSGRINFTIGVGERNVPLSPDTLVLPTSTAALPEAVVDAAMRVLGQAWSIANAPAGTLPQGVIRVSGQMVVKKALALAEAGLRVTLGQSSDAAVRDLLVDFFSGEPVDPGFDQLLRTTEAGHALVQAVGAALSDASLQSGGGQAYEYETARVVASSGSFISFGWDGVAADLAVTDGTGRSSVRSTDPGQPMAVGSQNVLSAVLTPLGYDALLALVTQPTAGPYRVEVRAGGQGTGQLSATFERPDGSFGRITWSGQAEAGTIVRVDIDGAGAATIRVDADGDMVFERTETPVVDTLPADGPRLLAAAVIGPETLDGAGPWGFQTALVFDRVVSEASAGRSANYILPNNSVRAAKRQLSGRLVFASLNLPEGPYVPSSVTVQGIEDNRGIPGSSHTTTLSSRLEEIGAVVSGRVLGSEGEPLEGRSVVYAQNTDLSCLGARPPEGMAGLVTDQTGTFELRYVRQDQCGTAFLLYTVDPTSGARRSQSISVRSPGQQILADFVMLAAGSVTGVVRDLVGQPVPGAKVVVLSQTETQVGASAVTDALGHYAVSGITVGPVVVRAGKGNGAGSSAGRIDRANVPAVIDVTIDGGSVTARGVIRKVEDGHSSPAAGAVVTYRLVIGQSAQVMAAGLTDSLGRYSFSGLPVGAFSIKAEVNTRDNETVTGTAVAGEEVVRDISVEIPPVTSLGLIEGVVMMPDGSPAPGAIVSSGGASVLSSEIGTFSIPVVPRLSPSHTVNAMTRDRRRSGQTSAQVVTSGQVVTGALITLSGLGAAEFTVVDTGGQPLPGRTVKLLNSGFDPCGGTSATTDNLGRARFSDLPLGSVIGQVVNEGEIVDAARASVPISGDGLTAFGILRVETRASAISGTVVDSTGQPVFGADVELLSPAFVEEGFPSQSCGMKNVVTHRARTGLDGRFSFSGVHPGRVYVSASQAFFPTRVSKHYDLQPTEAASVTLTLVDTISGEISGNVFEPDGITSAGGGVEVTLNGPLPDVTVFTNALGRFAFAKIFPAGSYRLTARDPITGLVERSTIYVAPLVDAVHDIRLKGKARVRVSVTDALAQPVLQAYVTLREGAFPSRVFEGVVAPSNQGVIEFPGVFEGAVSIEVRDSFGRGGRSSLTIPTGVSTVDAVVRISTTGTVRGRFLMPDNSPIPFGGIKLLAGNRVVGQATASSDNPAGGFEFTYVPAGPFRIEGLDPLTGRTGIAVGAIEAEGEEVEIDLRAQSIGSVSGVVTSNGLPLAGVRVDLVSGGYSATTTTDAAGRYLVQGVPEGRVTVSAYTGTGFLRANNSGTLSGEGGSLTLDVALRGTGSLSGQVFKSGGVATAGVVGVSLYAGGVGGGSITGSTDEDGTFSFDRVPAGLVQINIDALGNEDFASGTFEVTAGENTPLTLELNGIGDLRGRGLDSQGAPTPGRMVIQLGPPQRVRSYSINLGADGRFELPKVLAGPFTARLTVTAGGLTLYGTGSGEIADGELTEIDVQLQESGTVNGVVLRADGLTPAYGANVTLQAATGAKASQQAQPDGSFQFRGVVLGSISVSVADPVTAGVARATATIAANGDVVDLGTLILDDAAVAVVNTSPVDGALGIPVSQPVQVTFSDPLVNTTGVRVLNGAVAVGAAAALSTDGRVVTLTPSSAWPDSRELTIEAKTTVTDIFGRHPAQTFTSRFTTQDLSPPVVLSIAPANGATQVGSGASIIASFSEALSETTDLVDLIRLSQNGIVYPGITTLVTPDRTQAIFVPVLPLPRSAMLSIVVNGARDLAGNVQTTPFQASFRSVESRGTIVGRVLLPDQVTPASGSDVTVRLGTAFTTTVRTASDGRFTIGDLTLGSFTVTVTDAPTLTIAQSSGILATDGQVFDLLDLILQDNAASVNGQVLKADGMTPAGVVRVDLRTSSGAALVASTDESGRFLFARVLAGPATVTATSAASVDFASVSVEVPTTGDLALTLRMNGVGALTGLAIGSNGLPTSGVLNVHGGPGQRPYSYPQVVVGPDGRFAFPSLLAGPVTLQLQSGPAEGPFLYGTATGTLVDGQTTDLNVQLQASGVVKGRILKADGVSPADGAQVRIALQNGGRLSAAAGSDGLFTFNGVALGTLTLNALDPLTSSTLSRSGLALSSNGQVLEMGDLVLQIDTTRPSLSLSYPAAGSWTKPSPFIQVVFSDGQSGIDPSSGTLRLDGVDTGAVVLSSSYMQFSPTGLSEGHHAIDASISDRALNVATLHASFRVDATPPTPAVITSPASGSVVSGTVAFLVTSSDSLSGLRGVSIREGNAAWATTSSPYEVPVIDTRFMPDGRHTLTATAFDNVFNYAPPGPPLSIVVDNQPLTLTVTTPSTGQRIRDTLAVAVMPSEAVDRVQFTLGPLVAEFAQPPYVTALDTSSLAEGANELVITAHGPIGEPVVVTVPIFVDRTPPTGPDMALVSAEDSGNGTAFVTGSSGAAEAGGRVELRRLGSATVVAASVASDGSFVAQVAAAAGETIEIRALDSLGNAGPWRTLQVTSSQSGEAIPRVGMSLWVKAEVGILTDAEGFVSEWTDQSGSDNGLIQATAARRPQKVPNGFNGFPVVRFNGDWNQTQDFLNFKTKVSDIRTVFWVAKEDAPGSQPDDRSLLGLKSQSDAFRGGYGAPGTLWGSSSGPVVEGVTFINGQVVDGKSTDRPQRMSVISLSMSNSAAADMLGGSNGQGSWWGDFAEVIVYSRTLSDPERLQVEAYLIRKYQPYMPAAAPRISPAGGVLDQPAVVSLSAQPDATIRYTLDGSEPSENSPEYGQSLTISTTTTIKARAYTTNLDPSETATVTFLAPASAPSRDGMAVWVRADAGLSTESSRVEVWSDQSDSSNPLQQPLPIRQPLLIPNAVNGLPALRFDGEHDVLSFQTPLSGIRTAFWVVRQDPSAYEQGRSLFGGPTNDFEGGYGTPGSIWEGYYGKTGPVRGGSTFLNGVPVEGTTMSRPQQMSVISLVTTGPAAASELAGRSLYDAWRGDIAEVIVYDHELNAEERTSVESYLMGRYGITPGAFLAYGAVNVRLRQGSANAYLGGSVTLTSDNAGAPEADRTKSLNLQSGWASTSMPYGNISATFNYDGSDRVATGTLSTHELNLSINVPVPPITGIVFATDGVTPLPDVVVSLGTRQSTTDAQGRYRLEDPTTGFQSVSFDYQGKKDYAYVTVVASQPTELNKVHAHAATQLIRTVTPSGSPVPGATVITCLLGSTPPRCAPTATSDSAGELRYFGSPSGAYSASQETTAIGSDGAFGTATWWAFSHSGQTITVTLQPPGTVRGRVLTPGGVPIRNAPVLVDDANSNMLAEGMTDDQGAYEFRGLGGQDITVYAWSEDYSFEAAQSVAVAVGAELVVDLILPIATVDVVLHDLAGQPYVNQPVEVTTSGPRTTSRLTDANGRASFLVGPGFTQVIARSLELAAAEFNVALGETRLVTLAAGSHHAPQSIGDFNVSGSYEGSINPAQFDLYSSNAADVFRSIESLEGQSEARVASYGGSWWNPTPVYYHQTLFVPTSAAFARSITTFTNPSDSEVTVYAMAQLGAYGSVDATDDSLTVDGAYSVAFGRGGEFVCGEGCFIQHTLVLPPHSTKALVAFTTMDPALVPSLRDMSAEGAVAGLTEEDRQAIVNFDVPIRVEAVVEGGAQTATGNPLSGASVVIGRGDAILAQGVTGSDGAFSLAFSGISGSYRVVFSLDGHLFEATIEILASGGVNLGPSQALPPTERGSVRVIVEDGSTASVENLALSAKHGSFFGLDPLVVGITDATGQATLLGLIPGLNRIETPLGVGYVRVVAGAETVLRVQRGGDAGSASGRVTLNGAPVGGAVVVGSQYDPALNQEAVVARGTTDKLGRYTLTGLRPFDSVSLWAWDPDSNRHASSGGYVDSDTEPTRVEDISLATDDSIGSLVIRATDETTGQPLAGYAANLSLQGWPVSLDIVLDAQGEATVAGLPGGNMVFASVTGPAGLGRESALVLSGESATLNVPVGQRVALPVAFAPFHFSGTFLSEVPNTCEPFCVEARVTMTAGDTYEPFMDPGSASPSGDGRELTVVFHTSPQHGLQTTLRLVRRLYVRADGRFARIVDTIENVGDAAASANYIFTARAYAGAGVVAEILGGGTIDVSDEAIAFQSDQLTAETTGFAIRGTGGQAATSTYDDNNGSWRGAAFSWENLSLNPGEKVAFMSFIVFDRGSQAASVPARLQALLDLSDPAALEGLSAADRALIVNWILP